MDTSGLIESTYKKVTQLEHILIRPDTYVGSVEMETQPMWIFDDESNSIVNKSITFVPGLYKIFDEILVNAADNKQRDHKMDTIKIDIDESTNTISVWNNGKGLPICMHKTEKKMVPTMIFGTLLTSSNYDDNQKKVTGGRNGYGAKLCNIFSKKFTIETASKEYKKSFKQTWHDNMGRSEEPKIENLPVGSRTDFTCVKFQPDFTKFKMPATLNKDIVGLFKRRAYDIAASCRGVTVILNGETIPVKNLKDYAKMYLNSKNAGDFGLMSTNDENKMIIYDEAGPRWEIAFGLSDSGFNQVSFVNNIATTSGGSHVNHVVDSICKEVLTAINKKNKSKIPVKNFQVKNHMWIFINCLIENPTFSSQTKENMTLNAKSFGSVCKLSDKFYKEVMKCGFVENVLNWLKTKEESKLAKQMTSAKTNKLRDVPKLDDANYAGTAKSLDCTLILVEGDSAKTFAVSGLSVIGRNYFGIFPLKGKLLNVRDAAVSKISDNAEIGNIIKIMGLNYKRSYQTDEDMKSLRYGKIMILTDQDADGSHIKGLIINMFHKFWPHLLRRKFLMQFITPLLKVSKGQQTVSFFTDNDFQQWKEKTENWHTWKVKYYKGLGTSLASEAKAYFTDYDRHHYAFKYVDEADNDSIDMAFNCKRAEDRKGWLSTWMERIGIDPNYDSGIYSESNKDRDLRYSDFINKELIVFSHSDIQRSIPSLMDGFKPSQRKVIYTLLKRGIIGVKKEKKVAQLAGNIIDDSAYHHGEMSIHNTLMNLAQDFVGSNNINLLLPRGQFGTRIQGGSDSASPRYIMSCLTPLIKYIFHPDDTFLLKDNFVDNQKVEPVFYAPIIPMVLVNGAEGIGTGWSTKVPNFSPYDIINNLRRMIRKQEPLLMHPHYKDFTGAIIPEDDSMGRYIVFGECAEISEGSLEITELPIKVWTQNYKESKLDVMLHGDAKKKIQGGQILDYTEYSTDTTVKFIVKMDPKKLNTLIASNTAHKFFSLTSSISMRNCVLFDSKGRLKLYNTPLDIMADYFEVRMHLYHARKEFLEKSLLAEVKYLTNQARFITEIIEEKLIVRKKKKKVLFRELIAKGYDKDPVKTWKRSLKSDAELIEMNQNQENSSDDGTSENNAITIDENIEEDDEEDKSTYADYKYLLDMPIFNLTAEKIEQAMRQKAEKLKQYEILRNTTAEQIWINDLEVLEKELRDYEAKKRKENLDAITKNQKTVLKNAAKSKTSASKGKRSAVKIEADKNLQTLVFRNPDAIRIAPSLDGIVKPQKPKKTKPPTTTTTNGTSSSKNDENKSPIVNEIKPSTAIKSSPELSVEPPSKKSKISSSTSELPKITSFAERIKAKKIINDDKPGKKLGDSIIDEIDSSFEKEKENFESVKKTNGSKPAQKSSKKAALKNNQIISSSEDETPSENLAINKAKSQPKSSSSQKKKAIHFSSSDDEISESDPSSSETDDETLDNSSM